MRTRKIRGNKRRQKQIEKWRVGNLDLRLDLLEEYQREYAEIIVHPYCDISITNSQFPEPKGKIKRLILKGLIDIYESWKIQLDNIGAPYYLKIWLYEPRFSNSQVVCAIGDKIEFYNNNFQKSEQETKFDLEKYSELKTEIAKFNWKTFLDEIVFDNGFIGVPENYQNAAAYDSNVNWFNKLLKKPHKKVNTSNAVDDVTELYIFQRGLIWIGEK